MSELNNNLVENGIDVIRNCNSNDVKIEFITNVIAATEMNQTTAQQRIDILHWSAPITEKIRVNWRKKMS